MDTEKFKQVVEIVKSMNAAGASSAEIHNNLREMGISESDINLVLSKAKPKPAPGDVRDMIKHMEPLSKKAEEHKKELHTVKKHVEDVRAGVEEHAAALDEIAGGVREHKFKLEDIRQSLSKLRDRQEEAKTADKAVNYTELKEIKELLLDMKSAISALKSIDEKILKTNREVLMRLKR